MLPPLFASLHKFVGYDANEDFIITITGSNKFKLLFWHSYIEDMNSKFENCLIFVFEIKIQNKLKEFNQIFNSIGLKDKNPIEYNLNKYLHQQCYRLIAFRIQIERNRNMKEIVTYFQPIIFSENSSEYKFYDDISKHYSYLLKGVQIYRKDFKTIFKIKFYHKKGICIGCRDSKCEGCDFYFQGQTLFDTIQFYQKRSGVDYSSFIILLEIYFPLEIYEKLSKQINTCRSIINCKPQEEMINIYSCLNRLTITEMLSDENKWKCVNCKKEVNVLKKVMLYNLPKILIVAIKRFKQSDSFGEKIAKLVDFPIKDFNLSTYLDKKLEEENKYNLISVIYHEGSIHSGHYYAKCYSKLHKKWFLFDDHEVIQT